jgi:hypothetical protein
MLRSLSSRWSITSQFQKASDPDEWPWSLGLTGEAHLHRYLAEFALRYNHCSGLGVNDAERTAVAPKGIEGKAPPIGGLVKPRTLKQLARKLWRKRKV